ncbi:MAG: NADH:ubiquinone reductase (Na(+)-transporting) subunit F [Saprospiraceae bacterium]|nr:NADH:ubiquinone reductase (Na(+)-transporting) subunit F [Saprospiraceae bacterium]MBK8281447.1 NADH:ubiquinone reductase (Na(+)-transporting) subunit F [Saprospiraceae bacterium]MBK9929339.1 NADH:ubiquinone reductase (Na(+)-transporting) subunit F [Saprospiraceae bacterium]MBP7801572.1 NADH:ubiquinone reductase (Na(+)-transporting) subunit F [Saprospiraceae bacterium]MBP8094569.1 NADH:ubiquinone reductase (Na(+)-transporting) subunit F [Saprospiraceae bacterium]
MIFLINLMFVIWAIVAFSVLLLIMAFGLIYAQKKLVAQGDVNIIINGDEEHPLKVKPGSSLLSTLSGEKIFLPSACGGGGTCAMCECHVDSGGGDVLPTELNHLSRKEAAEHKRLACQVKVRQDMHIRVPAEVFGIKKWECEVISNYNVATFIKEFVVRLPEGEHLDFESGGYIQIDVPKVEVDYKAFDIRPFPDDPAGDDKFKPDWDKFNLWPLKMKNSEEIFRAYSMANHPAEGNIIKLNIRIATPPWDKKSNGWLGVNPGICSSYVFSRKPGDKVTISGPYGEFFIKPTKKEMVYIGGGAGMAPLRSHLFHLFHTLKTTDRKVSFWYGGRSKRELFYTEEFRAIEREFPNFRYHIALSEPQTEDNWKLSVDVNDREGDGFTGFIHKVLYDNYLKNHPEPEEIEYYFCGPPMMNAAVIKLLDDLGVPKENVAFDDFGG